MQSIYFKVIIHTKDYTIKEYYYNDYVKAYKNYNRYKKCKSIDTTMLRICRKKVNK